MLHTRKLLLSDSRVCDPLTKDGELLVPDSDFSAFMASLVNTIDSFYNCLDLTVDTIQHHC